MTTNSLFRCITIRDLTNFGKNQDVEMVYSDNKITVTSNQARSTPGIRIGGTTRLPKNSFYEFVVKGRVIGNATAFLWGDILTDKTRITAISPDTTKYLSTNVTSVSTVIGGFSQDKDIRLGVLFEDPSVGDQFEIHSVAVIERKSVQLGNWRLYDMPNNLVIDNKNSSNEWKFVAAYNKRT